MMLTKEFETKDSAVPVRAFLYEDPTVTPKACILYFHGGGLLYGNAEDLLPKPDTRLSLLSTHWPRPRSWIPSSQVSPIPSITICVTGNSMYRKSFRTSSLDAPPELTSV